MRLDYVLWDLVVRVVELMALVVLVVTAVVTVAAACFALTARVSRRRATPTRTEVPRDVIESWWPERDAGRVAAGAEGSDPTTG
ncbi:hypothetical protein [Angustibacter aerolatus]